MPAKVRKQIYLEKRQDKQLKRIAETRGVSEAEVIRRLIDAQAGSADRTALPPDPAAWAAILQFIRSRDQSGATGEPYRWNRDEIYEERLRRFGPPVNKADGSKTPTGVGNNKHKPRRKTRHQDASQE